MPELELMLKFKVATGIIHKNNNCKCYAKLVLNCVQFFIFFLNKINLFEKFYSKGNFRDTFDKVNLTKFYMLKT